MKKFHLHCATPCKSAASTGKNCGNESKNCTTSKILNVRFFYATPFSHNPSIQHNCSATFCFMFQYNIKILSCARCQCILCIVFVIEIVSIQFICVSKVFKCDKLIARLGGDNEPDPTQMAYYPDSISLNPNKVNGRKLFKKVSYISTSLY